MQSDDLTPAEQAVVSLLLSAYRRHGIHVRVGGGSSSRVVRGHVPGKVQEFWIDLHGHDEPRVSIVARSADSEFLAGFAIELYRCAREYRQRRGCL